MRLRNTVRASRNHLLLILAAGSLLHAVTIRNDFDPDAKFASYRTFSFVKGIELEKSGLLSSQENRERIKNLISGVLETKQLREVPRDQDFDLAVRYWVGRRQKSDVQSVPVFDPYWAAWGGYPLFWDGPWAFNYDDIVVRNYTEGTLILDLLERTTKQLVWRTYMKDDFTKPHQRMVLAQKDLNKAMLAYPPSGKEIETMRRKRAQDAEKQPAR